MDQAAHEISQLLHHLASSDNDARALAEQTLREKYVDQDPTHGLPALALLARSHPEHPIRAFAAVLLRRLALSPIVQPAAGPDGTKTHTCPLYLIPDAARAAVLQELLGALAAETVSSARRKLCDTIAEIAKSMLNRKLNWSELMPAVYQCIQSSDPTFRESAFHLLSSVPVLIFPNGTLDMSSVNMVFSHALSDAEIMSVRVEALNAAVQLLIEAEPETYTPFQALMVQMLNVLPALLANQAEQELQKALTSLVELATSFPKLFRPILAQLVEFALTLATHPSLEEATRHMSLELLLTLADEAPSMVRKVAPTFAQRVIPVCLEMMATIEDDQDWHTTDNIEDTGDENDEAYVIGEQAMDRLARRLGASAVTPVAFNLIPTMLRSDQWARRHAALMAISAIGEGCHKSMSKELKNVVEMVVPFTKDPHPRVRYAACNCIGQLATDFAPTLQRKYYTHIIPALMSCMDDAANPRVQAHGAAAMVNFCEEVDKSSLQQFLDPLFAKLVALSGSAKIYVQEQAITTMATVADAAEAGFAQYYPAVMPALLGILGMPNQQEVKLLRGKAMECATLIAMAVKRDVFIGDAPAFLQALARIQGEHDFLPYLATVMPPLLSTAQMKPEVAIVDSEEDADEYAPEDGWQHAVIEGQRLCIRTSLLDEKYSAIEMLSCYARNLGTGFRDWATQTMAVLVPNLDFYYHDGVRHVSAAAMAVVIAAAPDVPEVRAAWSDALVRLFRALPEEMDPEFTHQSLLAIAEVIATLGEGAFNEQQATELVSVLGAIMADYAERVKQREAKRHDEDYDPESEEAIEEEAQMESAVLTQLAYLVQALLRVYGAKVLGLLHEPVLAKALVCVREQEEDLVLLGLSLFDDAIEYCGAAAAPYLGSVGDVYIGALQSGSLAVRQSAAYGIGVAARLALVDAPALGGHDAIARARDSEDEATAVENAVAALAHILQSPVISEAQLPAAQRDELLAIWVRAMPIVYDEEEAPAATRFLVSLIDAQHPVVLANLDAVIHALLELVYQGVHEDMDEDEKHRGLHTAVVERARAAVNALSAPQKQALWKSLDDDKKLALKEYFK
ncbi:armadillo-type protein [Catenaria anguillulae PL171]|uniref:Armadillo-type protein n=1 Tax=Catenaria anguillulae PL171 TaxID=765915 RepID=A0A1Y2I5D7_9FUNG|nr:armadillo-type protein [Catenaria anguillulae PL171]